MPRARMTFVLCVLALLVVACGSATPEGPGAAGISPPPPRAQVATDTPAPMDDVPRTPPPPVRPPAEPMIAFHTDRDGDWEIYVMGVDGSLPTNLTNHMANDSNPAWSPDGRWIAFQSDRSGHQDIYVMAAPGGLGAEAGGSEGSDPVRITYHRGDDRRPSWSPDGTQLAFNSTRDKGSEVYVMNRDGSGVTRLTDDEANNQGAAWAPDGRRIAYSAEDAHYQSGLVAVAPDGSRSRRLTPGSGYHDFDPAFSPGGEHIAFSSERTGHLKFEVFVMPVTAGWETAYQEAVQLSDLDGMSWRPAWSPDGAQIAFAAKVGGEWGIHVMDADGQNAKALLSGPDRYGAPSWSPVGGVSE